MSEPMEIGLIAAGSALLGGLLGGLLSGAYQHLRDWLDRPRLEIDYEGNAANKTEANYTRKDGTAVAEIYIRVRVRNMGRSTAKRALVFLTSLKEVHPSGTVPTSYHDSLPLSWPGWDFVPRDIPPAPGVNFYVDLMKVSKDPPGQWIFCVQRSPGDDLKNYSGVYRFEVTATADNAEAATFEVDVTYEKDWHNLRAVPVRKLPHKTLPALICGSIPPLATNKLQ